VPLAARRSDRVIVPSRTTADHVVRYLGLPADRIDVIHEGVGASAARPLPEPEVRERIEAPRDRPIVLTVSAKRPHKNLGRLVDALAEIPAERRPLLVLPGYPTAHERELRRRADDAGVAADVRWLDWVEAELLEGLYAASECFVFPSLHEGFGLPVLEAMARGLPVACSNGGSLAEVAGEATLPFDPYSATSIATAIERLLGDEREAERLRAAGREQAARFSWETAAEGTLRSYERALGSVGGAGD
jgi:glycosyltransferase involved in cell wall biosynthesis